ncbi:sigma-54-dependent transcriptional regulator [Guptibacillus hwajinpoensis]|uniref:sigma-54-dependent transcriptional regulator n=1 Tax=Guptibacillus hwajinpoensis TaxID=208199 RepID=UPI001883F1A5|nr:sigma-54 dependent transcriptional regulator [Pseudalkalibacillus hwajinpoensis]MBF0707418.1 sigma-54-dependent Fis family transcriptional regulator [Pseudalkalibacillus hwajinpoensis]WLR58823.1 sigma-54 dependent transcriptional regulator [Pseudalkalibacillus hwajinpoensis]
MAVKVGIIDDETTLRLTLQMFLEDEGYEVRVASTLEEGWTLVDEFSPQVLLLDIRLPDGNGLDTLHKWKDHYPEMAVMMLTAYGDAKTAVRAIKEGAFDYLTKPFELEELKITLEKWMKQHHLEKEVERYREEERRTKLVRMIGESEQMNELKDKISLIAESNDTTVLVRGETGTGKELVARSIHQQSHRHEGPFVAVNCASIPSDLIEMELFGREKNSAPNQSQPKIGLMEWADGGTLFLDEIGDLSLDIQVKLLRFLEDKKIKRIGSVHDIEMDVRVIAATNRSLEKMIQEKEFRSDLYYRLNVVPVKLPPLRERENDIVMLTDYFLNEFCQQMRKETPMLRADAKKRLLNYDWPGNVRELKNTIERIAILHREDELAAHHFDFLNPVEGQVEGSKSIEEVVFDRDFSLEDHIESIEKKYIEKAIQDAKWNITQASKLLGISRYALQRRIDKYDIT